MKNNCFIESVLIEFEKKKKIKLKKDDILLVFH